MILILSFEGNEHVERVTRNLTVEPVLLDTAWFPSSLALDVRMSADVEEKRFRFVDGRLLDMSQVGAIWNRRLRPLELHSDLTDETARLFAWSESTEALLGIWYSADCFWMNPPTADEISQRKILQLQEARRGGLSIPVTLVTNDPALAREFVELHGPGNVIRKAFRNIEQAPRETSLVGEEELGMLDSVRYAPVIFQRFVPASLDLRVTIVDGDIFAAAITSEPEYAADYRPGLESATIVPYVLPDEVSEALLRLMDSFGLKFGAVDMRVTPQGEHVFLEVNPAGEFLFISDRIDLPIPAAIAAALERHDRAASEA